MKTPAGFKIVLFAQCSDRDGWEQKNYTKSPGGYQILSLCYFPKGLLKKQTKKLTSQKKPQDRQNNQTKVSWEIFFK